MKKLFSLLLVILTVTAPLSSCEIFRDAPDEITETTEEIDYTLTPTDELDPTKDKYGFSLFAPGDYLADPMFDTDEFLPDYDVNYNIDGYIGTDVCFTDDVICFAEDKVIYYMDKDTGEIRMPCGDPECTHSDTRCSAYAIDGINDITVYDGRLFWTSRYYIYSMNLDGTDRKVLARFISGDDLDPNWRGYIFTTSYKIHRGYVYLYGRGENTVLLLAAPLDGGEPFTIFQKSYVQTEERGLPEYVNVKCVGNDVYLNIMFLSQDNSSISGYRDDVELYRWSSKTRQAELIYNGALDASHGENFENDFFPVPGDGVYFKKDQRAFNTEGQLRVLYEGVCKYSFETGEIEHVSWLEYEGEHVGLYSITDKYFISSYNGSLYFFDHDGSLSYSTGALGEGIVFPGVEDLFPDLPDNEGVTMTSLLLTPVGFDDDYIVAEASVRVYEPDAVKGLPYTTTLYSASFFIAIPTDGGDAKVIY